MRLSKEITTGVDKIRWLIPFLHLDFYLDTNVLLFACNFVPSFLQHVVCGQKPSKNVCKEKKSKSMNTYYSASVKM